MCEKNEKITAENNDVVCEDLSDKTSDTKQTTVPKDTHEPKQEWNWQDSGLEMT